MNKIHFVTTVLTCFLSAQSHANLITQDLVTAGDNLVTYDDSTGDLWIKSSYTKSLTYGQVLDLIDSTDFLSGFEVAFDTQVYDLMNHYALPPGQSGTPWSLEGATVFYNALVSPDPVPQQTAEGGSWNLRAIPLALETAPDNLDYRHYFSFFQVYINDNASNPVTWTDYGTNTTVTSPINPRDMFGPGGFFLVKEGAPIPEPGSLGLLVVSAMGLLFSRRDKKSLSV